jgi:cytochrome c-type biogenesis protein CcmH/NrfG
MTNDIVEKQATPSSWRPVQVYAMATICLALGLALGYLFRGSETRSSAAAPDSQAVQRPAQGAMQMPTLDQMKQMADKKAEPLLAQLKSDPNNAGLLVQVAKIYQATHQFQDAANYYQKAVNANPKDVPTRTALAACLYYNGDVDGAISQLQQSLKEAPKDANSLFNLGMIRWKGKKDAQGAVQAWQQLLKSNPTLQDDKKAQVEKLIADARQQGASN